MVKSASGGRVSIGAQVRFEDIFPGGAPAGGNFTTTQGFSNASSQVSTIYAAPLLNIGVTIGIVGSIIDPATGNKGNADTIWLTINK
jgi:hypothetical protein